MSQQYLSASHIRRRRGFVGTVAATAATLILALLPVAPAQAAPVYQIVGNWAKGTPSEVEPGDVAIAEWRVNVNDDRPAPSNDPVENVTFTAVATGGQFRELPDLCLVDGVTPASSISSDKRTLVCNTGTQQMGTAVLVQTPLLVDGKTGEQLSVAGDTNGHTASPSVIPIVGDAFGLDMTWSAPGNWTSKTSASTVGMDFQWTLNLLKSSEPGPDSIRVRLILSNDNGTLSRATVCEPYTVPNYAQHPWSGGDNPSDQTAPFVDSCVIEPGLAPGIFWMTLTGIDYSLAQAPTKDAAGRPLPIDRTAVASGRIVVSTPLADKSKKVEVSLRLDDTTYKAPSGATSVDDTSNNTASKTWTDAGQYASAWGRWYTDSGGSNWDYTYRVSPGTEIFVGNNVGMINKVNPQQVLWQCQVLDSRYVEFVSSDNVRPGTDLKSTNVKAIYDYYVGNDPRVTDGSGSYDPDKFANDCAADPRGWTTTLPADLSTVKAVRSRIVAADAAAANLGNSILGTVQRIKDTAPANMDVWSFASYRFDQDAWYMHPLNGPPVSGLRYPGTTGSRDLVRIVALRPTVEKSVDRSVLSLGREATYTLQYAAVGEGALPATVDGFRLVDTIPVGLAYVPGSATPEPVVTTAGDGRQVLTWTLDGVIPNVTHPLTYRAALTSGSSPGKILTNEVYASYGGVNTLPAEAQVTSSTNGTTTIGKTADVGFIPNVDGDGVGEGSWTVTLRSYDPLPQAFTDTIDILPYVGDGRGTSFSGTYALTGVQAAAGAKVYYTGADVATLSDDPADASNGSAGSTSGNTVGWTTTAPAKVTAVRVIGPALAPGATQTFTLSVETDGVTGGDVLVNRAQARTEHTELVMRTSAPLSVANYYSAALKKYVQDANGDWRDANTVEDYPSFRAGETIRYRIVVENTGQGTLTGIEISDDKQPELGSFVIDSLAPGKSESHEFQIVADASMGGGVVNTACAAAETPADSGVPPTINCDPAGFEIDGEPTHTKSLISAAPIGNGQWQIVYGLEVTNTSNAPTSYSLDDELHFTDQVDIVSAVVSGAPDGVTLAVPAWNGQGNLDVATDVPLLGKNDVGYAPHNYVLTVVADVPLQFTPTTGTLPATTCAAEGADTDTAFNNTSELTPKRGTPEEGQACATPPSIDITKAVSSGPTPNGDGTWTVTYDVVAKNDGGADGSYDISDRMTADGDLEVISGAVVAAPAGVVPSATWTGLGAEGAAENVIASGVTLPAGGTHTYQVEVVIGLAAGTSGAPVLTACSADPGQDGGLSNTAEIEHNDLKDDASACIAVGVVTVDKSVSAGPTPNGDGTWTVTYDILATHVGAADADYDVTDRLRFGDGVEIVKAAVTTSPDGVTPNTGWTGLGAKDSDAKNVIAEGVTLAVGESHLYQVEVTVQMDEAEIDPAVLKCAAPGSGADGGLGNSTTLTSNGLTTWDEVCPTLPLIQLDKQVVAGSPVANGDGTWTIAYDVTATNSGEAAGDYDLSDRLRYGDGVDVRSAKVVAGPAGVATNAGWTGQGAAGAAVNVITTGVTLAAGATHTYRVEVIASIDRDVVTPGDLQCAAAGSKGGFANTAGLTHNGEDQDAQACVSPPLIEITKSLSGAVTPVDGEQGVYDASYQLTVTNSGAGAGVYDLDDQLAPGDGVTVVGIQGVTSDAADAVAINAGFNGVDDVRIVTAQPIAAAEGAPVVHTYTVTVRYAADLAGITVPAGDSCLSPDGPPLPGTLNNTATVGWNGLKGDADECIRPGKPTLDKALVSATPAGDGKWKVVYDLTVGNVGAEATTYDLDDEFLFAKTVTVDSVAVTGPAGVDIDGSFDGDANQRIATDVKIIGLDDEGYTPHVYRVTVLTNVPLHFDSDAVGEDGTGSPACTAPAGGNFIEQGLNNAATLTDETGGKITDTDCASLPSMSITKVMDGAPVKGANGRWTVNYVITATNNGAAAGDYTLTDELRYGAGIEVLDAAVTETPDGVVAKATWTGRGETGAAENIVAADVALAPGAVHTYRVVVKSLLKTGAADSTTLVCPAPDSDGRGGFANTAGLNHNDLDADARTCDVPEWPKEVPPPLAVTGGTIAIGVIGSGLLLLIVGGILLYARRRMAAE